jgi:hypothetical protein
MWSLCLQRSTRIKFRRPDASRWPRPLLLRRIVFTSIAVWKASRIRRGAALFSERRQDDRVLWTPPCGRIPLPMLAVALAAPSYTLRDVNDLLDGQGVSAERLVPETSAISGDALMASPAGPDRSSSIGVRGDVSPAHACPGSLQPVPPEERNGQRPRPAVRHREADFDGSGDGEEEEEEDVVDPGEADACATEQQHADALHEIGFRGVLRCGRLAGGFARFSCPAACQARGRGNPQPHRLRGYWRCT